MALYPLAGLDWRNVKQIENIKHLNIDIALELVALVDKSIPSGTKLPNVEEIPFPMPAGRAIMEVNQSRRLRNENKLCEAESLMVKVCQTYIDDGYAFAELGIIYDQLLKNEKATLAYVEALKLINDPDRRL